MTYGEYCRDLGVSRRTGGLENNGQGLARVHFVSRRTGGLENCQSFELERPEVSRRTGGLENHGN